MNRYFIVVQNAGFGKATYHVVVSTGDQYDGTFIGGMFVAGRVEGEFTSHQDAVDFIRNI